CDLQDRPASITNIEPHLGIKRQTCGNPKLGSKGGRRPLPVHAVDHSFVATTNVQKAIWSKGKARRIRNTRGQRHDLTFWRNFVERDRHVLAFRPADGRVDVPLYIYSGTRHRMQIICEPRRTRKRDCIALPFILNDMDTSEVSTLSDHAEQQGRRHEYRTSRAGAKHDPAGRQCLWIQTSTGQGNMPAAHTSLRDHRMQRNGMCHNGYVQCLQSLYGNRL